METKVTDIPVEEQTIWSALIDVWNKFCDLKQEHPQEQEDFMRGIHKNYPQIFCNMS